MPLNLTAALFTIAAPNFDRSVQFYSQFLNQPPTLHQPNSYAEFHLPGLKLGIFRPRDPHPPSDLPTPVGMALCLEVENLEAAIAHLATLGYPPLGSILTASHGREIYAYDPDGNWLILHQAS